MPYNLQGIQMYRSRQFWDCGNLQ